MHRAIELAKRGEGSVEPNPMVGCVITRDGTVVGEGWHRRFGGNHAEVEALHDAGDAARDATMFVTLEPCCHQGKTPPCTNAIVNSGIKRIVIAQRDPFPKVAGGGIRILKEAGLDVQIGVCEQQARALNAPYRKLVEARMPWVIAKWAMTLDGKIATRTGNSQWISNPASREIVHQIRGRVDAIMVGKGTVAADDPLLTARPAGPRIATRIVLDSNASLSANSQLVKTITAAPVLIAATNFASAENVQRLESVGCEVLQFDSSSSEDHLRQLLAELGRRGMTNILVEGGAHLLGSLHDASLIDEAHVFIASKIIGGETAPSPIGGNGFAAISDAESLTDWTVSELDGDVYAHGRCSK
jgi:diaminohydroxyphosphoribosylaminopyrimidine deaminase / 5-amino-6-(5-phosphoribosylamino)uracil reductase